MQQLLYLVPSASSYKKAIGNAFLQLGWKVKYFDYRKGDFPIRVYRFLPLIGGFEKAKTVLENRIIEINKELKPDLILTAKGELLTERVMKTIKKSWNITANIFPDYLNHWELIKKISAYYDFFFTFDNAIIKKLKRIGRKNVYYMPQATQPEKNIKKGKKYDVSFVGTYNKWRENYFTGLRSLDFNIWGDKRWFNSSLKKYVRGGRIPLKRMKEIIKKSRININVFFDDETPMEGVSIRPYEITGSGGFLLTQYVKDYDNVFLNKKEIVYFKTPAEMKRYIEFYLKKDDLRNKIAERGYVRTLKDHTYEIRMKQMLIIINKARKKGSFDI